MCRLAHLKDFNAFTNAIALENVVCGYLYNRQHITARKTHRKTHKQQKINHSIAGTFTAKDLALLFLIFDFEICKK